MATLGYLTFAFHLAFLLLAALIVGGSFGGFLGSGYMIVAALIVILSWGAFAALTVRAITLAVAMARGGDVDRAMTWANRLWLTVAILSPVTALALGFVAFIGCGPLWLSSLYHWGGMVGTILGFTIYFLSPCIVRACLDGGGGEHATPFSLWKPIFFPLLVAFIWGLVWLIPWIILRGDIKESEYSSADRVYKLPFPGGESSWVIQGNNSSLNHNNGNSGQKFSWDFRRRCGTPVLAARDGTILKVTDNNDGMGGANNEVQISHGTNGVSHYLHIQNGSVPTKFRTVGTTVKQGDQIAKAGSVGNSMTGHIHFMVKRNGTTVGVSFTDVAGDKGIPRTFHSYTSGNRK